MNAQDRPTLLKFSDFAGPGGPLDGKKTRIEEVLNIEILLLAFKMKESKYQKTSAKDCLPIQFSYSFIPSSHWTRFPFFLLIPITIMPTWRYFALLILPDKP